MPHILIAHAPEEEDRASLVAEKLSGLGYEVKQDDDAYRALSPLERRKLAASVSEAACVLVLWSREAIEAPALQAAAQAAKAQGKLALARMDASSPPPRMSGPDIANLAQWQGLDAARGWQELLVAVKTKTKPAASAKRAGAPAKPAPQAARASAPAKAEKKSGSPVGAIAAVLFVLAAIGGGLYVYATGVIGHP